MIRFIFKFGVTFLCVLNVLIFYIAGSTHRNGKRNFTKKILKYFWKDNRKKIDTVNIFV